MSVLFKAAGDRKEKKQSYYPIKFVSIKVGKNNYFRLTEQ